MPSQHESIREACDHCHNKKLRCERVQGSSSCRKCAQNSLTCLYSPRHLPGIRRSRKRPRSDISDLATRSGSDRGIQGQECPINAALVGTAACAGKMMPRSPYISNPRALLLLPPKVSRINIAQTQEHPSIQLTSNFHPIQSMNGNLTVQTSSTETSMKSDLLDGLNLRKNRAT
jgi:Fungal Zn(2)-Cys(6) binuclear cluster domain